MNPDSLHALILQLLVAPFQFFADPPPPAPILFPGIFLFYFFIPIYLAMMGFRSAFIDFKGWLLPRQARRLASTVNCMATLLLAGFLPGWLTTLALYYWYPEISPQQGLLYGFGVVAGYAVLYNFLLVRSRPGLAEALGKGYWHAVPMGGFFFCLYVGIFLYSGQAILAAFTFLFAPFGATLILPFAAGLAASERSGAAQETRCMLCSEGVDVAPVQCVKCEAAYHAECWEHAEGCARKDCRGGQGPNLARG